MINNLRSKYHIIWILSRKFYFSNIIPAPKSFIIFMQIKKRQIKFSTFSLFLSYNIYKKVIGASE